METAEKDKDWLELYREAILEPDPKMLKTRLFLARQAIQRRTRELWYRGSQEVGELYRLTAAAHYLQVLHSLADKKGRAA